MKNIPIISLTADGIGITTIHHPPSKDNCFALIITIKIYTVISTNFFALLRDFKLRISQVSSSILFSSKQSKPQKLKGRMLKLVVDNATCLPCHCNRNVTIQQLSFTAKQHKYCGR